MHDQDILRAATMYYVQDETMDSIAHLLGTSRSTVSRLLKRAREIGIVRVTIQDPDCPSKLSQTLQRMFNIRAHIVTVRDGTSDLFKLDQVAKVAAQVMSDAIRPGNSVGIAWGTTLAAVVNQLVPHPIGGVTVVGLNGGASQTTSGIPYVGLIYTKAAEAFGGRVVMFPVPAFFDYASTREAMWRERSVQSVLAIQRRVDVAVFGVGAFDSPLQSHVYAADYLDDNDLAQLHKDRVVGDVCTVMLRQDGTYADIELNKRATGLMPSQLRNLPRRIMVVAGKSKALPTLGALRAHVATDLVIDEETAKTILGLL